MGAAAEEKTSWWDGSTLVEIRLDICVHHALTMLSQVIEGKRRGGVV